MWVVGIQGNGDFPELESTALKFNLDSGRLWEQRFYKVMRSSRNCRSASAWET